MDVSGTVNQVADKTRYSCLNIRHFTVQDLTRRFMAIQLLFLENHKSSPAS